jgi:hypothetical protein
MCRPLEQPAAQLRFLKREGYLVSRRPNGRPFLLRAEVERVKVGRSLERSTQKGAGQPNRERLLTVTARGNRGPQAQRR